MQSVLASLCGGNTCNRSMRVPEKVDGHKAVYDNNSQCRLHAP